MLYETAARAHEILGFSGLATLTPCGGAAIQAAPRLSAMSPIGQPVEAVIWEGRWRPHDITYTPNDAVR